MKSIESSSVSLRSGAIFKHGFVHVVYFWLKSGLAVEEVARFESALKLMVEESEFAVTGHVGKPAGTDREVVDNSYDYCLIVTFEDAAGHQAYQGEAPHDRFRLVAEELAERVQIYDSMGS